MAIKELRGGAGGGPPIGRSLGGGGGEGPGSGRSEKEEVEERNAAAS